MAVTRQTEENRQWKRSSRAEHKSEVGEGSRRSGQGTGDYLSSAPSAVTGQAFCRRGGEETAGLARALRTSLMCETEGYRRDSAVQGKTPPRLLPAALFLLEETRAYPATMSAPSLAPYIRRSPALMKFFMPIANWYANAAGYRQLGLRFDDLIPEENDTVQLALKRLPPKEAYDRIFRLRRAVQCSLEHQLLPAHEQTKPSEDVAYLSPIIEAIENENKERANLDSLVLKKK